MLQLVQNGVSPYSETAGLSALRYPALPALSDLQIASDVSQAEKEALKGRRGLGRLFPTVAASARGLSDAIAAAVAGSGGTTAAQSSQSSLLALNPRATTSFDMLASRPMDSRTVTLSSPSKGLAGGNVVALPTPLTLTIPLRDVSIVQPSGAWNVGQGGFLSPTINVTCPRSPAAAAAGIAAKFTSGGRGAANVTLKSATQVTFTGVVGATGEAVGAPGGEAVSVAGASSATTDLLSTGEATTYAASSFSYVLSVDCGAAFGSQSLACGVGMEGTTVPFACPQVRVVPTCLWFDPASGAWSNVGTTVVSSTATAVTCSTLHLATHAIRLVTLPQIQPDIFASQSALTVITPIAFNSGGVVFMGLALAAFAAFAFTYSSAAAAKRFSSALEKESQVAARRVLHGAAKLPWASFSAMDTAASSPPPMRSAKVAPAAAAPALPPPTSSILPSPGIPPKLSPSDASRAMLYKRLLRLGGVWDAAHFTSAAEGQPSSASQQQPLPYRSILRARLAVHPPPLLAALWHLVPWGCSLYHPSLPTSGPPHLRLLLSTASLFCGTLGTVVLYVYLLGSRAPVGKLTLPALNPAQFLALSLANACILNLPFEALLGMLSRRLLWGAAQGKLAHVVMDAQARRAVGRALESRDEGDLQAALDARAGLEEGGGRGSELLATCVQAIQVQRVGAGGGAAGQLPLAAFSAALACASLFSAYYCYSFAVTRGGAAVASASGAWALAVAVHLCILHPLLTMALIVSEAEGDFCALEGDGGGGGGIQWGVGGDALLLGMYSVAIPRASAFTLQRGGGEKLVELACAALAPLGALRVGWERGEEEGACKRGSLLEAVYRAALEQALLPSPPAPPPALTVAPQPPLVPSPPKEALELEGLAVTARLGGVAQPLLRIPPASEAEQLQREHNSLDDNVLSQGEGAEGILHEQPAAQPPPPLLVLAPVPRVPPPRSLFVPRTPAPRLVAMPPPIEPRALPPLGGAAPRGGGARGPSAGLAPLAAMPPPMKPGPPLGNATPRAFVARGPSGGLVPPLLGGGREVLAAAHSKRSIWASQA
jgi:hypothetical protein